MNTPSESPLGTNNLWILGQMAFTICSQIEIGTHTKEEGPRFNLFPDILWMSVKLDTCTAALLSTASWLPSCKVGVEAWFLLDADDIRRGEGGTD
jgi:hypothetical protein